MAFNVNVVPLSSSDTVISQMGVSVNGSVHSLVICNNNASDRTFTLKLQDASEGITYVIFTETVAANSQLTWPKAINLESGDALIGVGADLVALQSTYVGAAVPVAQGFTGRGAWSSLATYQPNDVVSYNGSSYVANVENTDSQPPSADWTLLAAQGENGNFEIIRQPTAISPVTGGSNAPPNGPLVASPYAPIYSVDSRDYRIFEVTTPADTTFLTPVFTVSVNADSTLISPPLSTETNYIWRCKDVSVTGEESLWMTTQSFTTLSLSVVTPTITVTGSPSSVIEIPTLTGSAYETTPVNTSTHQSTDWEVRKQSDDSLVWSSYANTVNLLTITVPPDTLQVSTTYVFRVRYNSTLYGTSAWGSTTATTLATFPDTLFTPANTFSQQLATSGDNKSITALDDNTAIVCSAPYISGQTDRVLRVGIANKSGSTMVYNTASEVTVATDTSVEGRSYSVCAVTPTSGVIMWHTYNTTGTISVYLKARSFSVSGGVITLGTTITAAQSLNTATDRIYLPFVWRQSSGMVAYSFARQLGAASYLGVISITGLTLVANTAVSFSDTFYGYQTPTPVYAASRTDNTFVTVRIIGSTSTSIYDVCNACTINGSGATATITISSSLALTASGANIRAYREPKIVYLGNSRFLVAGCNGASTGGLPMFIGVYWDGFTFSVDTPSMLTPTTNFSSAVSMGLFRVSDTSALILYANGGYIINYTAGVLISTGTAQTLNNIGGVNYGWYTAMGALSHTPTPTQFMRFGATTSYGMCFALDELVGLSLVAGAITTWFKTGYQTLPNISNPFSQVLSTSRAISFVQTDATGTAYSSLLQASLWDISGTTPSLIWTNYVQWDSANWYWSVAALSSSRILLRDGYRLALYSISDSAFTLLNQDTTYLGNLFWSMVRINDTKAIYTYASSSNLYGVVVSTAGDTITQGTAVKLNITADVGSYPQVSSCADGRALAVWYRTGANTQIYGTLMAISGTTITPGPSEQPVTPSLLRVDLPFCLYPIDSNRYMLGSMHGTAGSGYQINVVQDNTTSIAYGPQNTVVTNAVDVGRAYVLPLGVTNGIIISQLASPDNIVIYSYTVGSGTALPAGITQRAILVTGSSTYNYYPTANLVTNITDTSSKNESVALIWDADMKPLSGAVGTGQMMARKFLRGTT